MNDMGPSANSVWFQICEDAASAKLMGTRSSLMMLLQDTVVGWKVTRAASAKRLGISRKRVDRLLDGDIPRFDLDSLYLLATAAGIDITVLAEGSGGNREAGIAARRSC